jgi:hypothetical protein
VAGMKTASFTVRASMPQSIAWKRAAESEGFASCGAWLARAADAYLKVRAKAGLPLPLVWRRGRLRVILEDGADVELPGWISRPFGHFHGTPGGPIPAGSTHCQTLVYLPAGGSWPPSATPGSAEPWLPSWQAYGRAAAGRTGTYGRDR